MQGLAGCAAPPAACPPLRAALGSCRPGLRRQLGRSSGRTPLAAPAPAAAAALPHALLLHEGALSLPLAAIVPEFPRIGGQPVRDWIGARVENLPGIDGDDIARLLLPDLVALVDGPTFVIGLILLIAFVYWEGGILLRQFRERRARRRRQRRGDDGGGPPGEALDQVAEEPAAVEWTSLDRARFERRRGLGWLALTTAALIWLTGVVNSPAPFQP